jgi:hypothetical protein
MQRNLLGGTFYHLITCDIQRLENSCVYTELRMIDGVTAKDIYTRRILYVYVGDTNEYK